MTIAQRCDECGATVTADDDASFGAAFLAHARAAHEEWNQYPDPAVQNYGDALLRLTGRKERLESISSVVVERVTADRIDDFLSFMDHDAFVGNPAWAACYCTEPHTMVRGTSPFDEPTRSWRERRETIVEFLSTGKTFGYLAYADGRPAGWVNASTKAECALYARGDGEDADVISISCFVIAPPYRRHGLADALLRRVIEDAPSRGHAWIEAYPPTEGRSDDAGNFRGPRALYARHGFEAVGEDGVNTVMRRRVE
jgi:GNAT superfamily N-acetyltransferase